MSFCLSAVKLSLNPSTDNLEQYVTALEQIALTYPEQAAPIAARALERLNGGSEGLIAAIEAGPELWVASRIAAGDSEAGRVLACANRLYRISKGYSSSSSSS